MSTVSRAEPQGPTREVIAQREIGQTDIVPALAWSMTVLFLLTLAVPPAVQLIDALRGGKTSGHPSCAELIYSLPAVRDAFSHSEGNLWGRTLAANRMLLRQIEEYEKQLEERSLLTRRLLGPTQYLLSAVAGL